MSQALLLVDVQNNQLEGADAVANAPAVREAIEQLLFVARSSDLDVAFVQNDGTAPDPDVPNTPGWQLVFPPEGREKVYRKTVTNSFAENPELVAALRERDVDHLTIAGMQSDYCIKATALAALQLGFTVTLASGAHSALDGDKPGAQIAKDVEAELTAAGVSVEPWDQVDLT
jgi:nicotinamidase-related amidase